MSDVAIRVEGLGKKYRLGAERQSYYSLRDSIAGAARKPLGLVRRLAGKEGDPAQARPEFWALKDVNFEVKHGEVLGIIGRNGAGKSTLLKLLSEITEPTTGRISINGRVASLLEVGTGFHPELTGRENIYLNGAILGMTKAEIAGKFDEIVAFAEVEKFIDTQVKHYSSGMYLRLAFAVAAHLEPEILVVDEVLAVGDSQFQQKCIGKMSELSNGRRTVLFVSHSMPSILSLCSRCVLLHDGKLLQDGKPNQVIQAYMNTGSSASLISDLHKVPRRGAGGVRFTSLRVEDDRGTAIFEIPSGADCKFVLSYESNSRDWLDGCRFDITFTDSAGTHLFTCSSDQWSDNSLSIPCSGTIEFRIPKFPLTRGTYGFVLFFERHHEIEDWIWPPMELYVVDGLFHPGSKQHPELMAGKTFLVPFEMSTPVCDVARSTVLSD